MVGVAISKLLEVIAFSMIFPAAQIDKSFSAVDIVAVGFIFLDFEGKGAGSYNYLLAPVIKGKSLPGVALREFPYAIEGKNTHILHLFGSLYGFIIADGLFEDGIDAMDVEGKMLVLNNFLPSDDRFPVPSVDAIRKVIAENIPRLEDALGSGAYFYDLPREYQVEDHFANMDIPGFLEFLKSLRLINVELSRFRQIAESLK